MPEIKLSIRDWIKLPETQALERHYKELGILPEKSSWDDFTFVDSKKAQEEYDNRYDHSVSQKNMILAFHMRTTKESGDCNRELLSNMSHTLIALRLVAIATKNEGDSIGGGRLIIQDRLPITIDDERDWDGPPYRKIMWYGSIFKLPNGYEPEE